MTTIIDLSQRSKIEDEAALWIARIDRGLDPEEQSAFQHWIVSSTQNYNVFMQFAEFWDITEQMQLLNIGGIGVSKNNRVDNKRSSRTLLFGAIAASFLMAITVFISHLMIKEQATTNDIILYSLNLESKYRQIEQKLPDGSMLILNAGSKIHITYSNSYRKILLTNGDIFIDVAHDANRPLTVIAKGIFFRALGTEFSVSATADNRVEMIVSEGSVMYGKEVNAHERTTKKPTSFVAQKGVKVTNNRQKFTVSKLSPTEINDNLSWRSGTLKFRGEPLHKVVKELERYTDKKFNILSKSIANESIIGRFKSEDIESFLMILEENFDIHWHEDNNVIYLTEKFKNP